MSYFRKHKQKKPPTKLVLVVLASAIVVGATAGPLLPDNMVEMVTERLPQNCSIKGNISYEGVKIYHMPADEYYSVTQINPSKGERWFCSESEARAAGWRRSKV